ncbi:MAG: hypothetical protein H6R14_2594 [Proteobacteria bacterium]|nr:hypothetical protein [Pseudomonadota bacterium]
MSIFVISALRAIAEMLGLCLLGQGALYVLAGARRQDNYMYRLFSLITSPPRKVIACLLPEAVGSVLIGVLTFVLVLVLWLGLAFVRKFV